MNAGSICTRDVDLAGAHESVQAVAARMQQRNVGSVVVVDERRRPVGIATDRDLAVRVLARNGDAAGTALGDVMTPDPRTIAVDAHVDRAVDLMLEGSFRRVVVVDRLGALYGVLSLDDVLIALSEQLDRVRELLERESPRAVATT